MQENLYIQPQNIEYEHFESLSDFKWCIKYGGEVELFNGWQEKIA